MKAFDEHGKDLGYEVYTADDLKTQVTTEVTAQVEKVKGEYVPKLTAVETALLEANKALGDRAGEFKQFRELHADVVAKLSVAERTIYENQKHAEELRVAKEKEDKVKLDGIIDNAIKVKSGGNEKLAQKVKDMYSLIGINATTPEEVEKKVLATLGALGQVEPDLIASVNGFQGGSFKPPETRQDEKSFADTEKAKAGMAEIGLIIPVKK